MIREFAEKDLEGFNPNKYSAIDENIHIIKNENILKYSVLQNDKVQAILCFCSYWENNWACSLLMSNDANFVCAKKIKAFLYKTAKALGIKRLQTDSEDCLFINRWHEFLGFECEGVRRKAFYGKDFKMWAMLWE